MSHVNGIFYGPVMMLSHIRPVRGLCADAVAGTFMGEPSFPSSARSMHKKNPTTGWGYGDGSVMLRRKGRWLS